MMWLSFRSYCETIIRFLRATASNASRVLAIVWASVRLSVFVTLSVSVAVSILIRTMQAKITKSSV